MQLISRRSAALRTVGVIAVLACLDLGLGVALDATGVLPAPTVDRREAAAAGVADQIASPALRDEPWIAAYQEDLIELGLRTQVDYVPYLVWGHEPFDGELINTTGSERLSYQPPPPRRGRPVRVAFFGGSTMFGHGQRDDHTIPSAFARIAASEGIAVQAHNYGASGWLSWQEVLYFERLLGQGEQYDLAVFYDGVNDDIAQAISYSPHPTHIGAGIFEEIAAQRAEEELDPPGAGSRLRSLLDAYGDLSGTVRLVDEITGDGGAVEDPPWLTGTATGSPAQQRAATVDLYRRATEIARDLAESHDVSPHFFWQPREAGWSPELLAALPAATIDLTHVLDDPGGPVYIDALHTNELGASIVAEAMWSHLGDEVRSLASA